MSVPWTTSSLAPCSPKLTHQIIEDAWASGVPRQEAAWPQGKQNRRVGAKLPDPEPETWLPCSFASHSCSFYFICSAACGNLSSPTKDLTRASCVGNPEP